MVTMIEARTNYRQKRYATISDPTINAIVKSLFRFTTQEQALSRIAQLKDFFVTSKQSGSPNSVIIWINGYGLTEEETAQGYMGNFAIISYKTAGKKFTISATKLDSELQHHPQRRRPKTKHPDWGHPVLRDIKKKRIYFSAKEASRELFRLHEEFPDVSIPDENRLMIIIYEKQESGKSPVQKYKFAVKALPKGGFFIEFKKNVRTAKPRRKIYGDSENSGYFTTMVKLKKKKSVRKDADNKNSSSES